MENRCSRFIASRRSSDEGPRPIGEILAEILTRYQVRFPGAQIVVVETPVAAA
jgi:hypothetical protein